MANRKQLKKSVKRISADLFADCVALCMCQQADKETLEQLMKEILKLHEEYVARISHTEKDSEKEFYKKFKTEFTQKVNDLNDRIIKA